MEIVDHLLRDDNGRVEYIHCDKSNPNVNQKYLIMHCTATATSMENLVASFLRDELEVSIHLIIGRDGKVVQLVPFNRRAWHANPGYWGEIPGNMNSWSLGIELVNAGYLEENDEGEWHLNGVVIPENDRVLKQHPLDNVPKWWQIYPQVQVETALEVTELLFENYPTLIDVLSHDEVNPKDRRDPGPAFDMQRFHAKIISLDDRFPITRIHVTERFSRLYVAPGVANETIGDGLPKNIPLGILKEENGWSHVQVNPQNNPPFVTGWIQSDRINVDNLKPRHYHIPTDLVTLVDD